MNQFEETLTKLNEESLAIKESAAKLDLDNKLFNEKLSTFLKAHGLSDNFTLSELSLLCIRKGKE